MTAFKAQRHDWPQDRAMLLVHGVGNYGPGDYESLKIALRNALGPDEWDSTAVYEMFWDPISDWFVEKLGAAEKVAKLVGQLRKSFDRNELGAAVAEGAGDVIWPVLHAEAREALRTAVIRQMQQMVADGRRKGLRGAELRMSVICHSLGCFHTYEALCEAAADPDSGLRPNRGVQFDAVVMMASPVQMIASVAKAIRDAVPLPGRLHCLRTPQLQVPGYQSSRGFFPMARRIFSLTGDLDPVGGYLFRRQQGWAYMDLPGTDKFVEPQDIAGLPDEASLAQLIRNALAGNRSWTVEPNNPHDWVGYVTRNASRIDEWLLS